MENKAPILNGITILFVVLTTIVIILRCYTRIFLRKSFGADDVLAAIAYCFNIALAGWVIYGTHYGVGRHMAELTPQGIIGAMKGYFISELLYVCTTCAVKISFGLMLLRINTLRWVAYCVYAVIAIAVAFTIFYFFFILFACSPVNFFWMRVISVHGHCRDPSTMVAATYAHGSIMAFSDLALAILPLFVVKGLQVPNKQKVTVVALLVLGSIASVATIARIPYVHRLEATDFTWENMEIGLWSVVEVGIAIVATGLATLRPLVTKFGVLETPTNQSSEGKGGSHPSYRFADKIKNGCKSDAEDALYDHYYAQGSGHSDIDFGAKTVTRAYATAI